MKKTLLTVLVIAASVCTAFAQDQKVTAPAEAPVLKQADQKSTEVKQSQEWQNLLVNELKLTDEQQKKIAELNKAFGERRQAIENNATLTDDAKAERKAIMKRAQEAQFMQILTPEQQAKYKELVEAKTKEAKKD